MYGVVFVEGLLALWDRLPLWSGPHWPDLEAALREALARWRAAEEDEERAAAVMEMEDALDRWAPDALTLLDALPSDEEARQHRGEVDLDLLLKGARGPGTASGARGVTVGRDVEGSIIVTGDGNRVMLRLDHRQATPPRVVRYPDVACPERVGLGTRRFQVVVRLGLAPAALSVAESPPLDLESGQAVQLHLDAPDFIPLGPMTQETVVPPNAPSPPVVFDLQPQLPGVHPLTLTFYQNTAALGSVRWSVEVVEATVAEAERRIPSPSLSLGPSEPPDRLLRIAFTPSPTPALHFQLVEGETWHPAWEQPIQADPARLAERLYQDLDLLRTRSDPVTGYRVLNPEDVLRRLKLLGQSLWRDLIPRQLKAHYAEHRKAWRGHSLLLYTAEPHVPWELVWPYGEGWEDEGPWAMTLDLARWLFPSEDGPTNGPPPWLPLTAFGCLAPTDSGLPSAQREADHLRQLLVRHHVRDASPPDTAWGTVVEWLEQGHYDWVHVAAHGSFYPLDPNGHAALRLAGQQALTPAHLVGPLLEEHLARVRPVFVINACDAGRLGWAWTGMGGWAQRLVTAGAGAFLAPMWAVSDDAAFTFATHFYEALLDRVPLGTAVRQAREAVRAAHPGDPTYLAYSLYAHPNGRVWLGETSPSI
ncbi:MAG TPA: CHAT domain-containing protein [Chloroflexi bacterium]|nr:CHAT domain-containing protein [Chloroflexota bacterium]